jgi:4-hydroxy-tetrahydrodipicolinate reductase
MKIALVGYGKMGRAIEPIALSRGHQIVTIDPHTEDAEWKSINEKSLSGVDVAIEFTAPEVALENIQALLQHRISVVVGTTGWLDSLEAVEKSCLDAGCGLVFGSNFSVGVNLFSRVLRVCAQMMNALPEYDVSGFEAHHMHKKDTPSGTALSLSDILLEEIDRKETLQIDPLQREIKPEELHFTSIRCGAIPGTHEIVFDSSADTISLKHTARGRDGFALGSVLAAEWVLSKPGFHTVDDFMGDFLRA